jgi:hypothetical protein
MQLSLVRVVLVLQARDEEVTAARRPYLFSRCLQRAVAQAAEFQASKPATMEEAAAARLSAERQQRVEQGAKETTAVPLLILSRRISVQVVAALALLALTAVQCAALVAMVQPISQLFMRVAAVLENLLAPDALAAPVAVVLVVTLSEQQEQQIQAAAAAALETIIQMVAAVAVPVAAASSASAISVRQSDR